MDEFCKLVFEASDYSVEYWMLRKPGSAAKTFTAELKSKLELMESRIGGYQQKVNLFYLLIYSQVKTSDRDKLLNLIADFFDALRRKFWGRDKRFRYASG